jgi:hypothetical protein
VICKNSAVPLKDQTCKSWTLKKEKEMQAKGIHNILNKIIPENFQNLEKELLIQLLASRASTKLDKNRNSPQHIPIKTTSTKNRERILKPVREKKIHIYNKLR